MSDRAGRCVADRAKAGLFPHCCDVFAFLVEAVVELVPDLIAWICILAVLVTFPVSVPIIAFLRRRRDRLEMKRYS